MGLREIQRKVHDLISLMDKEKLIRLIQSMEGNKPCYKNIKPCGQNDCLWRKECQGEEDVIRLDK